MGTGPERLRATRGLLIVALCTAGALQIAGFHDLRHDDAFITFRYAQNLATGNGLVFNPGEPVMGSTSPGHCLLAAIAYLSFGKLWVPSAMSALGCLAWLAQAVVLQRILRGALGDGGALFVASAVAAGAAWSHRYVALETNIVAAFVLAAILAAVRSRWITCALLSAAAGLMRPDAYLVAGPLGMLCVAERRAACWKPALVGLTASLPWAVFAAFRYGTVIPQSAVVKFAHVPFDRYVVALVDFCGRNLFSARIHHGFFREGTPSLLGVAAWLLAAAGTWVLVRRCAKLWVVPACAVLYAVAYSFLRASIGLEWHVYPISLIVAVLALSAVAALADNARQLWRPSVVVVVAVSVVGLYAYRTLRYSDAHPRAYFYGARHEVYRALADCLAVRARAGDQVAAREVGTLAYYTGLTMVDLEGLITPDIEHAAELPPGARGWRVRIPAIERVPDRAPECEARSEPVSSRELSARRQDRFVALLFAGLDSSAPARHR